MIHLPRLLRVFPKQQGPYRAVHFTFPLFTAGANGRHGLRRTNEDKRKAVTTVLLDDEWRKLSLREIAELCGVTHPFVSKIKGELVTVTTDERDASGKRVASGDKSGSEGTENRTSTKKTTITCKAGGDCEWESDGEGGRYCEKCHVPHPENLESYPDDQVESVPQRNPRDEIRLQKSRLINTIEAGMRAVDDLHDLRPNQALHNEILQHLQESWETTKKW